MTAADVCVYMETESEQETSCQSYSKQVQTCNSMLGLQDHVESCNRRSKQVKEVDTLLV